MIDFDHPTTLTLLKVLFFQCYVTFRSLLIIFRRHYISLVEVNQAM